MLGNPPYVRMEHLKALKPFLEKRYEVVSDRADLYAYFYERGLRLLKPGGRLGYISSSTFFKTGSGRPLREYLLREATIESVVDFGDLQLFEGVTTYPAIVTLKRGPAPAGHELRFWKVEALPESNFRAAWEAAAGPYPQSALGPGSWELENPALRALRDKIRAGKKTLKEVYGSPLYGVKTGLNAAFVIDTPTKERLCAEDPRSAELLKPFLEGKDLKRWRAEPRGLWLIYIPKNRVNIEDYPAIRDWLLPFKDDAGGARDEAGMVRAATGAGGVSPALRGRKDRLSRSSATHEPILVGATPESFLNNKCYFVASGHPTCGSALLNSKVDLVRPVFGNSVPHVRGGFHQTAFAVRRAAADSAPALKPIGQS